MKNQLRIMTKVDIYYFSATGNSLAVAKDIAEQTNGTLVPIISTLDYDVVKTDADVIGFVFPIYDFKPPELVDNLIKKIPNINSKYVFAVCTYGVMPLKTMKKLEKTLKSNGGNLSGGFTVKMPHNGVGYNKIPIEKQKIMFQNWEEKSVTVTDYVNNRKKGTIETSSSLRLILLAGMLIRFSPKIISMLGRAVLKGWDSLSFYTDEKCNSCGVCVKVCPVDNIALVDKKPVWSDKCITCFACLHWCPKESIQTANLTKKMERYHHPKIKLKEIIKQKEKNKSTT